jgi:mannose-1-phosphate guanylyltransferase
MKQGHVWAVVLAGGDGSRLGQLTTDARGRVVPKQYCSADGGQCLLSLAILRARAVAAPERVCAVVVADHWKWWQPLADEIESGNLIVQSADRGTGNAVMLAALTIMKRDPEARIVFLPSDHYAQKDSVLTLAARDAIDRVGVKSPDLVVVGITPDSPETDVSYLVPSLDDSPLSEGLESLTEPTDKRHAAALIARGSMWNSMIVAGRAAAFVAHFIPHHPGLVARMQVLVSRCDDPSSPPLALEDLYERLPSIDLATEILRPNVQRLRVAQAPACGWTKVSTVHAVQTMVRRMHGSVTKAQTDVSQTDRLRRTPNLRAALLDGKRRSGDRQTSRARA